MSQNSDDEPIEVIIEGENDPCWGPAIDALNKGDPKPLANMMRLEPAPAWVCAQLAIMLDPEDGYNGWELVPKLAYQGRRESAINTLRKYREYRKRIVAKINNRLQAMGCQGNSESGELPSGVVDQVIKELEVELGVSDRTLYKAWKHDDKQIVRESMRMLGMLSNLNKT